MTGARTSTLATLRGSIEHIEAHGDAYLPDRVALGHADADATDRVCRGPCGAGGSPAAHGLGASGFRRD